MHFGIPPPLQLIRFYYERRISFRNIKKRNYGRILQEEEVCDVKYATYDEIEELFQNNLFIGNRWEYVRDEIREYLLRSLEQEKR